MDTAIRKNPLIEPTAARIRHPDYKVWLASTEIRLGCDPTRLIRSTGKSLVRHYANAPLLKQPEAIHACEERLAAGLEYHWWKFCGRRFRPLDEVVRCVQRGHLASKRVRVDVLQEVMLTESVCRRDPTATSKFFSEFGQVVSSAAYRAGGPQARQELEGFEVDLILPRENKPPKLSRFGGHTPLANWLERVVWNEWRTRLRARNTTGLSALPEQPERKSCPDERVHEQDCLDVLQPLFDRLATVLDPQDAALLRNTLLEGIPQKDLAEALGVHTSTITRWRQRICRDVAEQMRQMAETSGCKTAYSDCQSWIVGAPSELLVVIGDRLAHSIRDC